MQKISLRFAIMSDDTKAIAKAPGIGARTAQRLILELKDKIVELLLTFFFEVILPLIVKYMYLIYKEQMEDWLNILRAALKCLPAFIFKLPTIDDVNYADITTTQNTPESTATC